MILSDRTIWKEIEAGNLVFTPSLEVDQVTSSALDLRPGTEFTTFRQPPQGAETTGDTTNFKSVEAIIDFYGEKQILSANQHFPLRPDQFLLAYIQEIIKIPNNLAARVEGRSSLARLGRSVHQTAPTVHAGFQAHLRLEISHNGPFTCLISPGQKICQLIIEQLDNPSLNANPSSFQNQG